MTVADLVSRVAAVTRTTKKDALSVIRWTFWHIAEDARRGGRTVIPNFGSWEHRRRKARFLRNPQTGERMKLESDSRLAFRAARAQRAP